MKDLRGPLALCYHGTQKSNMDRIMENGFNEGTYFATHLEDALGCGGNIVFRVVFEKGDELSWHLMWRFQCPDMIPPCRIASVDRFEQTRQHYRPAIVSAVFESNPRLTPGGGT